MCLRKVYIMLFFLLGISFVCNYSLEKEKLWRFPLWKYVQCCKEYLYYLTERLRRPWNGLLYTSENSWKNSCDNLPIIFQLLNRGGGGLKICSPFFLYFLISLLDKRGNTFKKWRFFQMCFKGIKPWYLYYRILLTML